MIWPHRTEQIKSLASCVMVAGLAGRGEGPDLGAEQPGVFERERRQPKAAILLTVRDTDGNVVRTVTGPMSAAPRPCFKGAEL